MATRLLFIVIALLFVGWVRSDTLSNGQDAKKFVQEHIAQVDVMVFAKSYCPHCQRTRSLLNQLHEEMKQAWSLDILDLDRQSAQEDGPKIQAALLDLTGQRTVPNIFIGQQHIGGNSDLQALHFQDSGLVPMLQDLVDASSQEDL